MLWHGRDYVPDSLSVRSFFLARVLRSVVLPAPLKITCVGTRNGYIPLALYELLHRGYIPFNDRRQVRRFVEAHLAPMMAIKVPGLQMPDTERVNVMTYEEYTAVKSKIPKPSKV